MSDKRTEEELKESIRVKQVTTSFMVQGTSNSGRKSSSFLSYTVSCDDDEGWTEDEARFVQSCVSEQVTRDVYADAFARGQIDKDRLVNEQNKLEPVFEQIQSKRSPNNEE